MYLQFFISVISVHILGAKTEKIWQALVNGPRTADCLMAQLYKDWTKLTLRTKLVQVQWDAFLNQEILLNKHEMSLRCHQLKPNKKIARDIRWLINTVGQMHKWALQLGCMLQHEQHPVCRLSRNTAHKNSADPKLCNYHTILNGNGSVVIF